MIRLEWPMLATLAVAALHGRELAATQPLDERALPAAVQVGGPAVWSVLATRRSQREYASRDLTNHEISQLLWAAQGVVDGHRTAPSAGALYPLTLYLADARGVWQYVPAEHRLVRAGAGDARAELSVAALRQAVVRDAAATFVIVGDPTRLEKKYGRNADRFMAIEAGHAAQNMLLAATALELAAVPVGAFEETAVRRVLAVPAPETPLYIVCVGARRD